MKSKENFSFIQFHIPWKFVLNSSFLILFFFNARGDSKKKMADQIVQLDAGKKVERWTIEKKLGEGWFIFNLSWKNSIKYCFHHYRCFLIVIFLRILTIDLLFLGAFGAVYRVTDKTGIYALKVEGANEPIQLLKMEVFVLNELSKAGGRHFCKIEDKGRVDNFNYVVMTFVGKSLQVCFINMFLSLQQHY